MIAHLKAKCKGQRALTICRKKGQWLHILVRASMAVMQCYKTSFVADSHAQQSFSFRAHALALIAYSFTRSCGKASAIRFKKNHHTIQSLLRTLCTKQRHSKPAATPPEPSPPGPAW
eukprot:1257992-Amphidinium_carterae.1